MYFVDFRSCCLNGMQVTDKLYVLLYVLLYSFIQRAFTNMFYYDYMLHISL